MHRQIQTCAPERLHTDLNGGAIRDFRQVSDPSGHVRTRRFSGRIYEKKVLRRGASELVETGDVYKIEEIIKTRKRAGKVEYFVKWKIYPEKFNSWVTEVFKPWIAIST